MIVSMTDYGYKTKEESNGQQVTIDLSKKEAHKDINTKEFMDLVGDQGYNFSGGLFDGGRKQENWKSQELFALDFDNKNDELNITPEQVLGRCTKYKIEPFGIYRTLGSETQEDKFRVLFRHYKVVENPKVANYMLKMFYLMFPELDTNCIEISRLFFGGKETTYVNDDAEFNIINLNNAIAQIGTVNEKLSDYKQYIQSNCENAKLVKFTEKMYEDYKNKEEINDRMFELDDGGSMLIEYLVSFNMPAEPGSIVDSETEPKPGSGKEFLGYQTRKKIKSALATLKKDTYQVMLNVVWGLKNTFGDEAYDMAWDWCRGSEHIKNNEVVFKKKWNDAAQREEITVGTIYYDAKQLGWEYKDEVIEEMNKRFFVSHIGGKTLVFQLKKNFRNNNKEELQWQDKRNFKELYSFKKTKQEIGGHDKVVCAADYWLNHEDVKTYTGGVHFDPSNRLPADCYNMWRGFAFNTKGVDPDLMSKLGESKLNTLMDHLKRNVCENKPELLKYLLKWMAMGVQKPWIKPPVALIFRGDNGVGKSIVANFYGKLFGSSYQVIDNPTAILGAHNEHLLNCVVLCCDEAFFGGNRKNEGTLKSYITSDDLLYNPKGIKAFMAPSYLHIIMTSNLEWVVPASENERRYCILDVKPDNIQDEIFFGRMVDEMESGGYEEFLYLLKNISLDGFIIQDFPKTSALNDQKLFSLDAKLKFVLDKLQDGILDAEVGDWYEISSYTLFQEYKQYIIDTRGHSKFKIDKQELGFLLRNIFEGKVDNTTRRPVVIENYKSTTNKRKWVTIYKFPPLFECRKMFERYTNTKIEWNTQDIKIEGGEQVLEVDSKKNKQKVVDIKEYVF